MIEENIYLLVYSTNSRRAEMVSWPFSMLRDGLLKAGGCLRGESAIAEKPYRAMGGFPAGSVPGPGLGVTAVEACAAVRTLSENTL